MNRVARYLAAVAIIFSTQLFADSNNTPAHNFTLPNLLSSKQTSLADFKGKVVYLDFWASWCKPCVESFPALETLYQKYHNKGFEIIAINLDEKKQHALDFLKKHPVSYQVLHDQNDNVAATYKVSAMPSAYFIDKKGKVRLIHKGFKNYDVPKIEQAIELLLRESE